MKQKKLYNAVSKNALKKKGLQLSFKNSQGLAAPHILWKRVP